MKDKKSILYILLSVLGVIAVYNYLFAPLLMHYNSQMGMGMHWRMYNNYNNLDMRVFTVLLTVIAGFLLYLLLKPKANANKCAKCGNSIESDRWKICPLCGTPVNNSKNGGTKV